MHNAHTLFYSIAYNRPDLIELQKRCLAKFIKNPHRLIVVNNGPSRTEQVAIAKAARAVGVDVLPVNFHGGFPSYSHSMALKQAYESHARQQRSIVCFLDCDIMPLGTFNMGYFLADNQMAGTVQNRGHVRYFWPGFLALNMPILEDRHAIDFRCGIVDGQSVDSGGGLWLWLKDHPTAKIRQVDQVNSDPAGGGLARALPHNMRDSYLNGWGCEVYEKVWFHLGACSNWNGKGIAHEKTVFATALINSCLRGGATMPPEKHPEKWFEDTTPQVVEAQPVTRPEPQTLTPGEHPFDAKFQVQENTQSHKIIVGVLSAWKYDKRRQTCRETWVADARRRGDIDVVFLVGAKGVVTEPTRIDDLLLLPCPDEYNTLPQKTRWFCKWALTQKFDYLFKCDDDTYVSVERLAGLDLKAAEYVGAEWQKGVGYGSGGAGYFINRRCAQYIADKMEVPAGSEDELVGYMLGQAGARLRIETKLVPFGKRDDRPMPENQTVTAHGFSRDLFMQSHYETGGGWPFRIVIPTSNRYVKALHVTLSLLNKYWPDHPVADVLHYNTIPKEQDGAVMLDMGDQDRVTWTEGLREYLLRHNRDQLVLLMLDDYGLSAPVKRDRLGVAANALLSDPDLACVHLTWQPVNPKVKKGHLLELPPWPYTVNTQAALWNRSALLSVLKALGNTSVEDFELSGSRWMNESKRWKTAQVDMPEPANPSGFVDSTDKTHWILPYRNLWRRGNPDPRHKSFIESEFPVLV